MTPESQASSRHPADQFMAVEIFFRLLGSADPSEMAAKLTEQLRELSGARTVVLIAHPQGHQGHQVLQVCPARRKLSFTADDLNRFCPQESPDHLPWETEQLPDGAPLKAALQREGIRSLLRLPLRVGASTMGAVLLFDLPDLERIGEVEGISGLLAPYFAMVLKQALDHQRILQQTAEIERHARVMEDQVEMRTRELAGAIETLKVSRLAALNLMEDAIEAQQRAEALSRDLVQKNQELEDLLYAASHDLRSPLLNVKGFTDDLAASWESLRQRLTDDDVPEGLAFDLKELLGERIPTALHFIKAGGEKLSSLIDGLLEVSRAGRRELALEPVDVSALMRMVCSATAFQIQACGAEVEVAELPPCTGDRGLLNQAFTNLLDNALKYRHPERPPRIRVTGHATAGGSVIYCMEDNGIGIEARHHARIWKLFHRLDPHGRIQGEGLGLSLVDRILKRHRGRVWVDSEPGRGSRFFVELPAPGSWETHA